MGRRFITLAAAAFVFAFSVTPVLADSREDPHRSSRAAPWTVVADETTDITSLGLAPVKCGRNTYSVVHGFVHFRWLQQGTYDSDWIALTDGRATETWAMLGVRVVDQKGRVHRVEGRQRADSTWTAGMDLFNGPVTSYRLVVDIRIEGTRDGHHMLVTQLPDGSYDFVKDTGTCTDLTLFY